MWTYFENKRAVSRRRVFHPRKYWQYHSQELMEPGIWHFRRSMGYFYSKIFWFAPRQQMVALYLDSLPTISATSVQNSGCVLEYIVWERCLGTKQRLTANFFLSPFTHPTISAFFKLRVFWWLPALSLPAFSCFNYLKHFPISEHMDKAHRLGQQNCAPSPPQIENVQYTNGSSHQIFHRYEHWSSSSHSKHHPVIQVESSFMWRFNSTVH